ncbi:MAG: type II toxin-antitoxin system prevent-host-death family antitoxin [Magnetococcus sp. YQC-5]
MIINIHEAKTHLSQLIQRALSGEKVIVAKAGKPLIRLAPFLHRTQPRISGSWQGKISITEHFDAPLPDHLLAAFYDTEIKPDQ